MTTQHIAIAAVPGTFDTSLALTLNVMRAARTLSRALEDASEVSMELCVCTPGGRDVELGSGLVARADRSLEALSACDVLILPGLGLSHPAALDAWLATPAADALVAASRRTGERGALVAASCSSVFALAAAGLVTRATTSWWLAQTFRDRYPDVELLPQRVLVEEARVMCAGAAMAHADLMIAMVARLWGEPLARAVARYLLIDRRELQSQYVFSGLESSPCPDVARARDWVRAHISEPFSVGALANGLGMSARTLSRRLRVGVGQSPSRFVQGMRVEHARHLLENTDASIAQVAASVGYDNPSSLRRVLRAHLGTTPGRLR